MHSEHHGFVIATAGLAISLTSSIATAQVRFQGLGPTPAGPINIQKPPMLSQDGRTVIVNAGDQARAFRWREESGWEELAVPEFTPYRGLFVRGVSGNGRFIVGSFADTSGQSRAVLWTDSLQARVLPTPAGATEAFASTVSDDGRVAWGVSRMAAGSITRMTKWSEGAEPELFDEVMSDSFPSVDCATNFGSTPGCGMRANGSGSVAFATTPLPVAQPFARTNVSRPLGDVPGGSKRGSVRGVSTNGQIAVGDTSGAEGWVAFRWTAETGMRWLGPSEIGITNATFAYGTSDDGQVIVGYSETGWNSRASVWSPESGWSNLKRVLMERYHQSEPEGWWMWFASGVSADGSVIIGTGHNPCDQPDIWMARLLPALPACVADFNQDGFADFFDLAGFTDTFERAGPRADLNADCFVDFFDFSEFIESFDLGC